MGRKLIRSFGPPGWAIALAGAWLVAWVQASESPPVQFKIPGQNSQPGLPALSAPFRLAPAKSVAKSAAGQSAHKPEGEKSAEPPGESEATEGVGEPAPAGPSASAEAPGQSSVAPPRRNVLREPGHSQSFTVRPSQGGGSATAGPQGDGGEKSNRPAGPTGAKASAGPVQVNTGGNASPAKSVHETSETSGRAQGAAEAKLLPVPPVSGDQAGPFEPAAKPDPEPWSGGPTDVEAASFNGITPGASTLAEVEKAWGAPQQTREQNGLVVQQYRVPPFERVEVVYPKGAEKVASIVIRLEKSFPAEGVARQLELHQLRPVLVSNELGEILGQAYPERGVLFSFEPGEAPGKPTMRVAEIVLEPITADPFLLRAETYLDTRPEESLKDVEQALALAPAHARGHWLRARLLGLRGELSQALAACEEACRLAPVDAQYRLTRAQLLGQLGRLDEAIAEAQKAIEQSGHRQHIKARSLCLLGDLHSAGARPEYKKAVEYHMQAIQVADALATSPHPAIRVPAKEVLLDAHLGAAHDIAWGKWNQKQTAVSAWLKRASALADDLIQTEGGTVEHRFRVAARALAACVGAQGQIDPAPWIPQMLEAGQELLTKAAPAHKAQVQWEMGLALYDAVQIYQMRGQRELALKYGRQAVELLEQASLQKGANAPDRYLLGRLYFRLGSLYAIGSGDHRQAVLWFDKAVPVLQQCATDLAEGERGRLGETLVSMAVSYWEAGQRQRAQQLTEQGMQYMQQAVQAGMMEASALEVPKTNLATMRRHGGSETRTAAGQPTTIPR